MSPSKKPKPMKGRVRLTLTRKDALVVQDAVDDYGPPTTKAAMARYRALQRTLHAFTGEELPPSERDEAGATPAEETPPPAPAPRIHTPLTVADRDAVDAIRLRIRWQAIVVQRALATWDDEGLDFMDDRDRSTLEGGLIELCTAIVRDIDELHDVIQAAETRTLDAAKAAAAGPGGAV